jgi:DNA-binding transcriptional ArsR family regulator
MRYQQIISQVRQAKHFASPRHRVSALHIPIMEYNTSMPRAPTTADVFNAIAEPRRRQIVELLARRGALTVGTLVVTLGLAQPAVSKHLGVLRKVGVVAVIKQGKQRVYNLEAEKLKTVHDWVKAFEELWGHQLDRIKERAEHRACEQTKLPTPLQSRKGQS